MARVWLPLLALANLALAALLALLWIGPDGRPRDLSWRPPAPLRPVLAQTPALPAFEVDTQRYVATLERPLFTPGRRPPKPPEPAAPVVAPAPPPPPPEPLPDIRLVGLYSIGDSGGVIASVDGRVRRLKVGESIGSWSLKEIKGQEIVLARGDDVRTIPFKRRTGAETPPAATPGVASVPVPGTPSGGGAPSAYLDAERERAREQVRRMNVFRARSGMAPLPEP